jgi:hypothetical protein
VTPLSSEFGGRQKKYKHLKKKRARSFVKWGYFTLSAKQRNIPEEQYP